MFIQIIIEIEMRHAWLFVVALRRKAVAVAHTDDRPPRRAMNQNGQSSRPRQ